MTIKYCCNDPKDYPISFLAHLDALEEEGTLLSQTWMKEEHNHGRQCLWYKEYIYLVNMPTLMNDTYHSDVFRHWNVLL